MSEFEERILPDVTHPVRMEGEINLYLNGSFDSLHYFEPLDVNWIRYWNEEIAEFQLIVLKDEAAIQLINETDLPVVWRESIFEAEHKLLIQVLGEWITDSMFELEIDEDAIEDEF